MALTAKCLTGQEKIWVRRLEAVLLDCPHRLGLYTVGDRYLTVFDALAYETVAPPASHTIGSVLSAHNLDLGVARSAVNIYPRVG